MRRGFTLVEMIVVMAIIVIVFLISVPNIQKTLNVVNDKGCDAQVKLIDAAILQWTLKHDSRPLSLDDLIRDGFISERQSKCSDGTSVGIVDGQAVRQ